MYTPSKANSVTSSPNWTQILDGITKKTGYELNCVRIGMIQEFFPEDLTADVLIVNKKTIGLNSDGTQNVRDFALIRAKVCYCNPFETFPLKQGDECVLLFSDREIESWFINGSVNPEGYPRMHDLTDAIAIVGIRSLPQMISILTDCLHLFYGLSSIKLGQDAITIESGTVNINGDLIINGQPYTAHQHTNGNNGANTGGIVQ